MNIYEYMSVGENEKPLARVVTDGGFCSIFRTPACIGDSLSSGEFESVRAVGTKPCYDFYDYSWGSLARTYIIRPRSKKDNLRGKGEIL